MEDIVFQEEEQHLDQVERKIQKSISSTSYEIERMNREINAIRSHFDEKNISWYSVDDRKISILTVENAKGLEFEAVAVIPKGMEINEQYIAYTRALDHLHIVT